VHREIYQMENALKQMGAIAMLACARIGAVWDRLANGQAKAVITADGGWMRSSH
jgi:acyl-coenzyme A synthetase/AMP-(fatty) acid ligase